MWGNSRLAESRLASQEGLCSMVYVGVNQSHYRPVVPRGFQEIKVPNFMTTAQDGGKVVSLPHRLLLPPGNTSGVHYC